MNNRYCYPQNVEMKANEAWVFVNQTVENSVSTEIGGVTLTS